MLAKHLIGKFRIEGLAGLAVPVNILLVILVAHSLATLTWKLIPVSPHSLPGIDQSTGQPLATPSAQSADHSAIAEWHLFGEVNTAKPPPRPVVRAPETKLNLRLVGTLYAKDDSRALAIIAEGRGEERVYFTGDELSRGVRLVEIRRDQVVLSRNGRPETLSLPRESQIAPAASAPGSSSEVRTGSGQIVDASGIAGQFRDSIKNRPQHLQDLAYASPFIQNGEFRGFSLQPGKNQKLLGQLGLKHGDVIVAVNGTRLANPVQAADLLIKGMNSDQIDVLVLRNNTEMAFTFSLNGQ